jgi:hypothetical protein
MTRGTAITITAAALLGAPVPIPTPAATATPVPPRAQPQASPCLPADSTAERMRDSLVKIVTSPDSSAADARVTLNLPSLAAADVRLVREPAVCSRAAARLAMITNDGDPNLGVLLWRVGSTRYVAYNGHNVGYGAMRLVVFDEKFTTLSAFSF